MKGLLRNTWLQALAIMVITSAVLTAQSWAALVDQVRAWRTPAAQTSPAASALPSAAPPPAPPPQPAQVVAPSPAPADAGNVAGPLPATPPPAASSVAGNPKGSGDIPPAVPSRVSAPRSPGGLVEFQTGMGFYEGVGVAKDFTRALESFQQAAAAGNAASMGKLGWMHWFGEGTEPDAAKGADWFRRGASAGDAESQYWLATFFEKGYGNVKKDGRRALELLQRSAGQGFPKAVEALKARGEPAP